MNYHVPRRLIYAFAASFFATGIPYWLIPYNQVNLPDALIAPGLIVVCFAALLMCLLDVVPFWKVTAVISATVPAVVIVRVIVEGVADPTSHNLWPFEVIIAIFVGFLCTLPGAAVGFLIAKLLDRKAGKIL